MDDIRAGNSQMIMRYDHHHDDEGNTKRFIRATGGGVRKHAVSLTFAAVVSTLTGTFIPMLEVHWQDQTQREAIQDAVAPLQKQIDELKQMDQNQWQAISNKEDKQNNERISEQPRHR